MSKPKSAFIALTASILFSMPSEATAAFNLTADSPGLTENFNSMWNATSEQAVMTLPEGWRIDRNMTAPRRVSKWDDASTEVMYAGGAGLPSNAKNGTWNFGSSSDPGDRAVGGLTTTVSNGTRGVNVMTALHNGDDELIINYLDLGYVIEKYRKGANAAGFAVQLYYSADGDKWTSAGDDFATRFDPDNETLGAADVPISATAVSGKRLRVHVEPGKDIYLAWNISVASGTTPDKAPGLALDDVSITALFTDNDDDWNEPDAPVKNPSGIYLRGDVNGWGADEEWEFDKTGDGTYRLVDKTLSGGFKVADATWSSACNYGSNGSNIIMDSPYGAVGGTDSNISCGPNTYICKQILLSITDGQAVITLESDSDPTGLTSVYVVGDCNGWNYMDKSGELSLNDATGKFEGRVTMKASSDGLSHWRIYQRLGMGGAWGLVADSSESSVAGTLFKGETGNVATAAGTYNIVFDLSTGAYSLTKVESVPTDMVVSPAETTLVPLLPEKVRVLSLNNSLIHYNDQSAVFNSIAEAMDRDAEWTKHTLLGKSLATHWDEGDGLAADGMPGAKMMVRSQPWSHIILQEQSSLPRTNLAAFRDNVARWVEYIRTNCPNPNAVIILPVNWAYAGDWDNFTTFNNIFIANYIAVADELGVTICPVISAYQSVYDKEGTAGIAGWFQDDRHPTDMSTYMAACMEYGLIFGVDPETITFAPAMLSESDAAKMRSYASEALSGWINTVDHTAGKVRLKVSVTDEFGVEVDPGDITFAVDNNGTINENNEFVATEPGIYTVTVSNGTFTRKSVITVAEAVTEMPAIPYVSLNADNLSYRQNFDGMGDAAAASLPEGWRIDRQTSAPRTVGTFNGAASNTTYAGGVSLPSNAKNGTWNFGDNGGTDRAVGGITTGVADGSRAINVYAHFKNDGNKNLENISLGYNVEKYRDGNNAAGFTVKLYYSADGNKWNAAPDEFTTFFEPAKATVGFDKVPSESIGVIGSLPGILGAGCDLYFAWNISVTSGDNCAGAPALAIDDFTISASLPEIPVFDHYIYIEDKTGYEAMGVYAYGDKEIWGAWPGQAMIDETVIDGCRYKVFGHDEASGNYSLIVNNWNRGKQLPDFPIVGGRDYYLLATPTSVTEKDISSVEEITDGAELSIVIDGAMVRAAGARAISVYSVAGVLVDTVSGEELSLSGISAGVYIVEAASPSARTTSKVMIR